MGKMNGMQKEIVVSVAHLYKKFGNLPVLVDFNMELYREENLVVLGRSGSGKSVLIKCIVGLIAPDHGIIKVLGQDINQLREDELDQTRARMGFLFQSNALYDSMTIGENLRFPLKRHGREMTEREFQRVVTEALADVGLEHTIDMMPSALSGGMAKRIALARAMILKPEIMCYDEPTAGLDPVTALEIESLILTLKQKYRTSSILISHDMNCVRRTADRVVLLLDGKCYAQGSYSELKDSADYKVKQFFQ
ncbi:ATP-binding cassette domain-containing protein [Pedobacter sp. Du54]|uniref:ABC transporter ATP-binding protein n=1 Tax=Pedobacter anseongensis TaxID=3133439 RepID=UPI003097A215